MASQMTAVKRAIGEDERMLARRSDSNGTREKLGAIVERIGTLHVEIEKAQSLEATNREVEGVGKYAKYGSPKVN